MWKRESDFLTTNSNLEGTYQGKKIITSKGSCKVKSLKNAKIQ